MNKWATWNRLADAVLQDLGQKRAASPANPPFPTGADPAVWAQYESVVAEAVEALSRVAAFLKYDPHSFYEYAQFRHAMGTFQVTATVLTDVRTVRAVVRRWDDVLALVDAYADRDAPFRSSLIAEVKHAFGRGPGWNLVVSIVTDMTQSRGVRWMT